MPLRVQWAHCFIRHYRNFGIRVTSGTEASNNNIKGYLLNGLSHLYRLIEVMQDMIGDQERSFIQACAQDEVLASQEYTRGRSEYLGELRMMLSSKALGLIRKQYLVAKKALPTGRNPKPVSLGDCTDDCSVPVEYGIPCCHTIYKKLIDSGSFSKWEVHPRWRLRETTSQDPYRRILDPKIAGALRGRPKNTAVVVPSRLAVREDDGPKKKPQRQPASQPSSGRGRGRPPGSRNKTKVISTKSGQSSSQPSLSQRQTRSQGVLGTGKTTGSRMSGRQLQASVRRRRSQRELLGSDTE
ncbi:mutator-like element [Colletotrichum plurivorum]|uniref:Mutator-like element n=1 Tax=Colletotrichum plurivorum TaxID=2175906 RepID=A0A8H6JLV7_9PEZI|nr:mutator-like element [Colletotrichum plurivorum]